MKLAIYFYIKALFSFTICLISSSVVFYIFSLIGNLEEKLSFSSILIVSFLDTLLILSYIPSFIILLSIIILIIFLRSKNELMIFKEYLSYTRLIILFLPLAFVFSFIEMNKNIAKEKIENSKLDFLKSERIFDTKVIVSNKDNYKSYTIFKGLNIPNNEIDQYQRYEILNSKIKLGEFSNQIEILNGLLITRNFTKFENGNFSNILDKKIILDDYAQLMSNKLVIKDLHNKALLNYGLEDLIKNLYFIIFFVCMFIILFNRKVIDRKRNFVSTILICFAFLFYSIIIFNIQLSFFNKELQILALLLITLSFYKFTKYE